MPRSSRTRTLLIQWSFTGNAASVHRVLGRTAAAAAAMPGARIHFEGRAQAARSAHAAALSCAYAM